MLRSGQWPLPDAVVLNPPFNNARTFHGHADGQLSPGRRLYFDRDYYITKHIPIAQAAWDEFGLRSTEVLFPTDGPQPLAGMLILRFDRQASLDAALTSPRAQVVLDDALNFTNIRPLLFRADN